MPTWDQFMNERSAAGALDDADDIIVQQSGVSKETDLGTLKTYIAASLSGITASSTDTLTNKTLDSFTNTIEADTIHIQVRNDSGSPIAKGTPVYVTGYNVGQALVTVAPADASSAATMPAIGLTETELLNNSNGAVDALGRITGVDTSSYSEGDILYVSETAGALTDTAPTGTAVVQPIATVLRSNASTGVLAVSAQGVIPAEVLKAANVSVADAGSLITGTTVEAALQEIFNGSAAVNTNGTTGSTETLTLAPVHKMTMDQNCTFTFPTPTTAAHTFVLYLAGSFTPTFPASVDWASATAPTYATPSIYVFHTNDTGTTWFGALFGGAGGFG